VQSFLERGGAWVAAQVVIFLAWFAALAVTSDAAGWVRAIGWGLLIGGGALAVTGLVGLGRNLTPYPEPVADGRLVEHGIYRAVRHPIYGGIAVGAVGGGLALDSVVAALVGVGLLGFFAVKARREERRLESTYPAYVEYRQRVRGMLLPWLF
jgi:protein-S-isoprenylcysteine O-methyltransferase Ste14